MDELTEVTREVLSLDKGGEDLLDLGSTIEKAALKVGLQLKQLVH